jgi:hypothetical protein
MDFSGGGFLGPDNLIYCNAGCHAKSEHYMTPSDTAKLLNGIQTKPDNVNNPKHYTEHPSKIECITITEHMNFCLGNAMKYIWRADLKGGTEDLEKAIWYLEREIARRETK